MNHLETKILGNALWEILPRMEQFGRRLGSGFQGGWARERLEFMQMSATPVSRVDVPCTWAPPLTQSPPPPLTPRCVVLKLASLGMFSFSLGQTLLCFGRNKTSCESYGYNACDYQVAGDSIRACPSCPLQSPTSLISSSFSGSHLCERLWAELPTQQSPPGGVIHITFCAVQKGSPDCGRCLLKSYPRPGF